MRWILSFSAAALLALLVGGVCQPAIAQEEEPQQPAPEQPAEQPAEEPKPEAPAEEPKPEEPKPEAPAEEPKPEEPKEEKPADPKPEEPKPEEPKEEKPEEPKEDKPKEDKPEEPKQPATVVEAAAGNEQFSTLVKAVQAAGLAETLSGEGPFTVLAPTNEAFEKLPEGTLDMLLKEENKEKLQEVLKYHVIAGKVPAAEVTKQEMVETLLGKSLPVKVDGDKVTIGPATVVKTDIMTGNGVIHVIDTVLVPEKEDPKPGDIVEVASGLDQFSTLVKAVKAAGLVDALKGEGPFTVLAPTNEAFEKLPEGTLETLLKEENKEKLQQILKYHVVPSKATAEQVTGMKEVPTLAGPTIPVKVDGDKVMLGDATVVKTDVMAANGVIHVIDTVLLPPEPATPAQAREVIEQAVAKGAPIYNGGNPQGCVDVYQEAVTKLQGMPKEVIPQEQADLLSAAVKQLEQYEQPERKAWVLRKAMDKVYLALPAGEAKPATEE